MSIFQFSGEYNQRQPPSKINDGSILRYKKNKGYESIPREFAQNESLTYEARGMLISIASYPSNFKLYKCELYNRSKLNSRRKIDRAWEELIEQGYILQFRKRSGKNFFFSYLFSLERYETNDLLEIFEEAYQFDYLFYHRSIRKKEERTIENYQQLFMTFVPLEEINQLFYWLYKHELIWNVQNEHSKKTHEINDFSNVQYEQPKMDSSYRTSNKLTSNKSTKEKINTKECETEKNDTRLDKEQSLLNSLGQFLKTTFIDSESLKLIADNSKDEQEVQKTIDLLYQSKKYIQDHLDGFTIVAEYFEEETQEMLKRYYFKKKTKKIQSQEGYFYNVCRNHWLTMAERLLHQYFYPNKQHYLQRCSNLFEQLNANK